MLTYILNIKCHLLDWLIIIFNTKYIIISKYKYRLQIIFEFINFSKIFISFNQFSVFVFLHRNKIFTNVFKKM